jgi:antagonist of KipI
MGFLVERAGFLSVVQDLGRYGYRKDGVCVSGALDSYSARIANWLVGHDDMQPVIEMTLMGATLHFTTDTLIAVTGGEFEVFLNGCSVPMWTAIQVYCKDVLTIGQARKGTRAYLSFSKTMILNTLMGSYSTHLKAGFGGFKGRSLKEGDAIGFHPNDKLYARYVGNHYITHHHLDSPSTFDCMLGPDDYYFSQAMAHKFLSSSYSVSLNSDRMGIRLIGPRIEQESNSAFFSEPGQVGVVQVPSDGEPIILLNDSGTIGGYPKIATIASYDLWKLGQLGSQDQVTFHQVSLEDAWKKLDFETERLRAIQVELLSYHAPCMRMMRIRIKNRYYQVFVSEL